MESLRSRLALTIGLSLGSGVMGIVPVVTSDNGYVAGFVYFPLLLIVVLACSVLFIIGFAYLFFERTFGLYFLLAMILLPVGFFGAAFTAKYLELGAYKEEPMMPMVAPIANKVLFKKEATHDEIERFWTHVIGYPTNDQGGHWSRPGVAGGARSEAQNGHEVIVFSFRPEATEEEKNDVRLRIRTYPPVHQFLENVNTTPATEPSGYETHNSNERKSLSTTQGEN